MAGFQERNSQLPVVTVRKAVNAGWADDWSELMKSEEVNPWVMTKLRKSYYQAGQEDDQRKGIVQKVMQKSTDLLERIVVPVEGQGGSHCPTCALIAADALMKVTPGALRWSTETAARRVNSEQSLGYAGQKVFRAHAPPEGPCENLMCAIKLLAILHAGGANLVDRIFEGLQEQRLKITNEIRRFIEVDKNEVVKIGDLEKNSEAIKVVRPNFNKEIFPDATIRAGVGELTLRTGEAGTLRTLMGSHRSLTRLARSLPCQLQGRRWSGMREVVLQVCGGEQGSQCS